VKKVNTKAKLWILSTEREFYRPSNTARILKLANPEATEIFHWERSNSPKELIEKIESGIYDVYLLFPQEEYNTVPNFGGKGISKIPAFILLDGTWKEAKKIVRKSEYLKDIPTITLKVDFKSKYTLRKGVFDGNLCTMEAAIEVIKLNKELEQARVLTEDFNLFLDNFKASVYGHKLDKK
jgi:DTW domain-containing protein YfiP